MHIAGSTNSAARVSNDRKNRISPPCVTFLHGTLADTEHTNPHYQKMFSLATSTRNSDDIIKGTHTPMHSLLPTVIQHMYISFTCHPTNRKTARAGTNWLNLLLHLIINVFSSSLRSLCYPHYSHYPYNLCTPKLRCLTFLCV